LNTDIADLSGATPGVPAAPGWATGASGGRNGVTPAMRAVYGQVVSEMAAAGSEVFVVAGDLINGRWYNDDFLDMFAPVTRSREAGIGAAGGVYYRWYRSLLGQNGLGTVIGAVGDHELGDDPWPVGDEKSVYLGAMRSAFGREIVAALPIAASLRGIPTRPEGTPFAATSYAYQHRNVLFVSVDVFRQAGAATELHPIHGTVVPSVEGAHLAWLDSILSAADSEPSIDHVIVQVHAPVLSPVRMQTSSGIMLEGRKLSGFWDALRRHDHARGGKVRLLFAGEVHAATATRSRDSDVVQLVHGNPPRAPDSSAIPAQGQYLLVKVLPKRIDARLVEFDLAADGSSLFWQADNAASVGVTSASTGRTAGTFGIDVSTAVLKAEGSGALEVARDDGLGLHLSLDEASAAGPLANTGSLGNEYYAGLVRGTPVSVPGRLSRGLRFDGVDDYVESGRGNPTGSDARTVAAWIRTTSTVQQTIFSYGAKRDLFASWFELQLRLGKLQLSLGPDTVCRPSSVPAISDGQWHHVAVVLPKAYGNLCPDAVFYVDGVAYRPLATATRDPILTVPWDNFRLAVNNKATGGFFSGDIDDAALWGAGLEAGEARALVTAALEPDLAYNAAELGALITLFRDGQGLADVGGRRWVPGHDLAGDPGDVMRVDGRFAIVFDADGGGVAEQSDDFEETLHEAESAILSGGYAITDRLSGYTGTGYVEFLNKTTAVWTVSVSTSGTYELGFRYAVGIDDRKIEVAVDGIVVPGVTRMPSTGAWTQWGEVAFDQFLTAGEHTVRLTSLNLRGANVDHLFVRGEADRRLLASPPDLAFSVAAGSGPSEPRLLRIEASDGGSVPVELTTTAAWLSADPGSGLLPLTGIEVRVEPGSRVPGVYEAEVIAAADGYADLRVPVAMTVTGGGPEEVYEAESAILSGGYEISSWYSGYTGSGYVMFMGQTQAVFSVAVAQAGTVDLVFRYSVGISDRKVTITLDGSVVPGLTVFPTTSQWTAWNEVRVSVSLSAGTHSVGLYSPHLRGPNVDHLRLVSVP
jgi:hypothetical protein